MAPSQNQQTQKPMTSDGAVQQPETAHVHELQTVQPAALQAMNPQKPHPEDENMGLRGGDRGGLATKPCAITHTTGASAGFISDRYTSVVDVCDEWRDYGECKKPKVVFRVLVQSD
ncbi:hypothetical protein QBC42DRAFT_298304 [Cladorrhinum samala]|uniref:Uncharacterized protein n=1 Tax=Cladorrhinum samala TaxID=585594 RepID=A0AAV9HJG5_9PEZI|nr:hypothetical protein QBC42DRAFT_298304 [Cladorrhinum samala]